jgi:hypothetical protein
VQRVRARRFTKTSQSLSRRARHIDTVGVSTDRFGGFTGSPHGGPGWGMTQPMIVIAIDV